MHMHTTNLSLFNSYIHITASGFITFLMCTNVTSFAISLNSSQRIPFLLQSAISLFYAYKAPEYQLKLLIRDRLHAFWKMCRLFTKPLEYSSGRARRYIFQKACKRSLTIVISIFRFDSMIDKKM